MWVPVPPSAARRPGRGDRAGQHLRVADHRSPAPRTAGCWSARRARAASAAYAYRGRRPGRVEHRPVLGRPDDGLRVRRPARRDRALPRGPRRTVVDVDLDRIRQERLRQGTFDDNRARRRDLERCAEIEFALDPPTATSACGARSTGSRSCPTTSSGWRWTATRPTTSRSPASSSGCSAIGQPKVVIGVSGGLDSTHALIVAAKAMDRLDRPRSDILAFTLPGFATGETTKSLRHAAVQGAGRDASRRSTSGPPPSRCSTDMGHPFADGRGGLRRHLRERPGRPAHRLPVPDRQPARGNRARHRRPLRAGARLVHVRRRRPDVALHRQRRRAEDADPAPDPLGGRQRAARSARRRGQRAAHRDRRRRRSPPS